MDGDVVVAVGVIEATGGALQGVAVPDPGAGGKGVVRVPPHAVGLVDQVEQVPGQGVHHPLPWGESGHRVDLEPELPEGVRAELPFDAFVEGQLRGTARGHRQEQDRGRPGAHRYS